MKIRHALAAVLCIASGPAFASPQGVAGTWEVVATPTSVNTCGGEAEVAEYRWIVSENLGDVSVVVEGESSYPKLSGKLKEDTLLLDGSSQARLFATAYPNAVFVLHVKDRKITGARYLMHFKPAKQGGITTCLVTYTVTGKMKTM